MIVSLQRQERLWSDYDTHQFDLTRQCNQFAWPHAVLPEARSVSDRVHCTTQTSTLQHVSITYQSYSRQQSTVLWDLQVNGEDAYVVLNAGCRDKDIEHIQGQLKKFQVSISVMPGVTLHIPP